MKTVAPTDFTSENTRSSKLARKILFSHFLNIFDILQIYQEKEAGLGFWLGHPENKNDWISMKLVQLLTVTTTAPTYKLCLQNKTTAGL